MAHTLLLAGRHRTHCRNREWALPNLPAGDHYKPEYLAINPESTIPTLVHDDGSGLTEFQAIAWWLARRYPKAKLLPDDADGEARVIETMSYVVGTIHGQGYTRIFTIDSYTAIQPGTKRSRRADARLSKRVSR